MLREAPHAEQPGRRITEALAAHGAPTLFCIPGAGASVTTRNPLVDRAIGMPIACPPA
ncbi:putative non-ribosomal peptide synthetase [Burkholderia humptydooensis]|nr:hypothetical protein [Burkholderia humptydooensis]AJY40319.1 putative non-ribosomal peptide synthetase [Burkholderia sp. 2002721687]